LWVVRVSLSRSTEKILRPAMYLMSTSKLVKVCLAAFSFVSHTIGMTTRLPLRRFSLRKIVYPESLHVLTSFFHRG
jgi:hypothetical protein